MYDQVFIYNYYIWIANILITYLFNCLTTEKKLFLFQQPIFVADIKAIIIFIWNFNVNFYLFPDRIWSYFILQITYCIVQLQ